METWKELIVLFVEKLQGRMQEKDSNAFVTYEIQETSASVFIHGSRHIEQYVLAEGPDRRIMLVYEVVYQ